MIRKRKGFWVLLLILILWLGLMWRLSAADGTETLRDSMAIAQKLGQWLYDTPTAAQLSQLNLHLRKLAHIFLYGILGVLFGLFFQLLWIKRPLHQRFSAAAACTTAIAFLDELQKIPISGRHFDLEESLLNAFSALIVLLLYFFVKWRLAKKRQL